MWSHNSITKQSTDVYLMCVIYIYLHLHIWFYLLITDNIAWNKTAMQSSTYGWNRPYPAALAVDGNTDPVFANRHCSHTNEDYEPWWAVDLGERYIVLEIGLTNRKDYGKSIGVGYSQNKCIQQIHILM